MREAMSELIFTIGHSTHSVDSLVAMLRQHDVTAVADVRSQPYSRVNPQFNRDVFRDDLRRASIAYVFLGDELGARVRDESCYVEGKVQYDRLAQTDLFRDGIRRLQVGAQSRRIAVLCAEKDPLTCHRGILISRHLVTVGLDVRHILYDGRAERHDEALTRLLSELGLGSGDLFRSREQLLSIAYARRGDAIAYVRSGEREVAMPKVASE